MTIEAVRTAVVRVAHFIDAKQWADLRALYAEQVDTDYTSLFGGERQRSQGDDLVGRWKGLLSRIATQHLLGPIDVMVDGDQVRAECHVTAIHAARGLEWTVYGHYVFGFTRVGDQLKIAQMTLIRYHETGTRDVLAG